jgi:hypothetical protein
MPSASAFWKSLEVAIGTGAREERWRAALGDEFPYAVRYLAPMPSLAEQVTATDPGTGRTHDYRIVEHEDGSLAGICDEEGAIHRREFRREELVLFRLNEALFAENLARCLELEPVFEAVTDCTATFVISRLRGRGGEVVPVVFARARDGAALLATVQALRLRLGGPFVLLLPTMRRATAEVLDAIGKARARLLALEDRVLLRKAGLAATSEALEEMEDLAEALVGEEAPSFRHSGSAGWADLTIRFEEAELISVSLLGARKQRMRPADIGLASRTTGEMDQQWGLLYAFALGGGEMTRQSSRASPLNQKRKERLVKKLKAFFQLPGEPILSTSDGGWRTVFRVIAPKEEEI